MSGIGSAQHLAGVEFALRTGVQWTYVPYKGGSAAIADVVAGHADVLFNGMLGGPSVHEERQAQGAGRVRAEARRRRARPAHHRRSRACPASRPARGKACWRRPARRARSSTS